MGYNLAIEFLADFEKTWELEAFQKLDSQVLQPQQRGLKEWLFLEVALLCICLQSFCTAAFALHLPFLLLLVRFKLFLPAGTPNTVGLYQCNLRVYWVCLWQQNAFREFCSQAFGSDILAGNAAVQFSTFHCCACCLLAMLQACCGAHCHVQKPWVLKKDMHY